VFSATHDCVEQLRVSFVTVHQLLVELGVLTREHELLVDNTPPCSALVKLELREEGVQQLEVLGILDQLEAVGVCLAEVVDGDL